MCSIVSQVRFNSVMSCSSDLVEKDQVDGREAAVVAFASLTSSISLHFEKFES